MSDDIDRLEEIRDEMTELLEEATSIVSRAGGRIHARAKAYWIGQLSTTLSNESDYVGKSMCTLEDTIQELKDREDTEGHE